MKGVLWKFTGVVVGLLAVAWTAGLLWFASTIPKTVADQATHTDAIVALTGGAERIETGMQLLSAGLAERLFISGAGELVRTSDILGRATPVNP